MSTVENNANQVAETLTPLQQALLSRADAIMDSVGKTVDKASQFAADQVPDIAMQYVAYGRASNTVYLVIGIAFLILAFLMWFRWLPKSDRDDYEAGYFVGGLVIGIIGLVTTGAHLNTVIMVWFAPKIYLINEIARLAHQVH